MKALAPIALLLLAAGCATTPAGPPGTLPDTLCWSRDTRWGLGSWKWELAQRFGDDVVILETHGGTDPATGRWALWADDGSILDADTVAWVLRTLYPRTRAIALVACNRDSKDMHVPGVWYAKTFVTQAPGLPIPGDVNTAEGFIEGHR